MHPAAEFRAATAAPPTSFELREGLLEIAGTVRLHHGGALERVRIAWWLAGARGAPVVTALGGISAHRHVFTSGEGPRGWWDELVGPGRALDSERFRVLGFDFLGGSGDTTGPRPGEPFPSISTYDQAEVLLRLANHLNVASLHAVVGASYGGMVALAFAERYPERVGRLLVIGAADRSHPLSTAWRSVQRRIVRFALDRHDGAAGLELARALAMTTYRSADEFAARFNAAPDVDGDGYFVFPVESYLFARGADYAARYRPQSFLCLSESIDLHAVDAAAIRTRTTIVAVREDQLVPFADACAFAARLGARAQLFEVSSVFGHDAFLKEAAQLHPLFADALEEGL